MKISIITAVYNNKDYITQALESVINQTYKNIEFIVIDGGSTDGTFEKLEQYKSKFAHFISEKDSGIYEALNKGISLASGDVIGFLHSDDLFADPTIIQTIADTFIKNDVVGVYGDLLYVDKNNPNTVIRYWESSQYKKGMLKKGWMPPHPTLFIKKTVYENYGVFDTSFSIASDYNYILKIFSNSNNSFKYISVVITKMRVGGKSNTIKNMIQKWIEDYKALRGNKIGGLYTLAYKNISKIRQFF